MTAAMARACVLGAGVMGSQIAALLANAGLEVDLLDLAEGDEPAGRARAARDGLPRRRPPALYLPEFVARIHPGSLVAPGAALARADWVIEAVVEDLAVKRRLLEQVEAHARPDALLSTNTSGLSIAALAADRGEGFARRFLGVHFFNPPRYMKLVEVIPGPLTARATVEAVSRLLRTRLGKGVVECRDTPNFIANRLGVFAVMDALHRMAAVGLSVDEVDAVTGVVLGRPRSATLRLCDLIGLDTLLHVAGTAHAGLPDDPARGTFLPPLAMRAMVDSGLLGEKAGGGFYRKGTHDIEAIDTSTLTYGPRGRVEVSLPTRGALGDRLAALLRTAAGGDRLATFARDHLLATLGYCAGCVAEVADGVEDVDRAMRWGFNWEQGPFAIVDAIGVQALRRAFADAGLGAPALLDRVAAAQPPRIYCQVQGTGFALPLAGPAVHRPLRPAGPADDAALLAAGETLMENEGARLVYLGDGAAAIELRGRLNVLGPAALSLARDAVEGEAFDCVALTGAGAHFSAGADLKLVLAFIDRKDWQALEEYLRLFQEATAAMRYASVPVVAAARGLALGGGCELCLSAMARVVAGELRIGLVEAKVGLIPGAGGCKEMVRRFGGDVDRFFATLRDGQMSDNAEHARALGFVDAGDELILDEERILQPAMARARALADGGWTPPEPAMLSVAGATTLGRLEAQLQERATAGQITAHDAAVGRALARVVCGGGDDGPVSEQRLLELEREAFLQLCGTEATRARIAHMLDTGQPLRN